MYAARLSPGRFLRNQLCDGATVSVPSFPSIVTEGHNRGVFPVRLLGHCRTYSNRGFLQGKNRSWQCVVIAIARLTGVVVALLGDVVSEAFIAKLLRVWNVPIERE